MNLNRYIMDNINQESEQMTIYAPKAYILSCIEQMKIRKSMTNTPTCEFELTHRYQKDSDDMSESQLIIFAETPEIGREILLSIYN